ncbi:hypothetical protein ACFRAQ_34865 [Nocardia sp. NPDC056611]|uniref:hypothetical protein n=1 Tax=Nocardia sp. NPDC056611 TaxID=3345877 RepID=UPI00366BED90
MSERQAIEWVAAAGGWTDTPGQRDERWRDAGALNVDNGRWGAWVLFTDAGEVEDASLVFNPAVGDQISMNPTLSGDSDEWCERICDWLVNPVENPDWRRFQ